MKINARFISPLLFFLFYFQVVSAQELREQKPNFKKVFTVVLENSGYFLSIAQHYLRKLAKQGASLKKMTAEIKPSQGNYIAMTSGNTYGVNHDHTVNLDVRNIVDLLEEKCYS